MQFGLINIVVQQICEYNLHVRIERQNKTQKRVIEKYKGVSS